MTDARKAGADTRAGIAPRAFLESVPLYQPGDEPCAVDLSDNTNLWGAPPAAARELRSLSSGIVARYPDLYSEQLRNALARHFSLRPDMIVTGCGSDDVLDAAIRAFGEPGSKLAYIDPTFTMIPTFARLNGLVPQPVALTASYDADADGLLEQKASIIYLCSPNNPTGTTLTRKSIEYVLETFDGVLIIDEAYAEFAGESVVDLLSRYERLLVARTFSKAYGLAGLRVGYMLGASSAVAAITKVRGPYKVTAAGERAARTAVLEDQDWVSARALDAVSIRQRLTAELQALGLAPLPSRANFVLVPVHRAPVVAAAMRRRGVLVRAFGNLAPIDAALRETGGSALRIGVGPWDQVATALTALREALAECA
jgi:histidinol-phosphate aminotransferase